MRVTSRSWTFTPWLPLFSLYHLAFIMQEFVSLPNALFCLRRALSSTQIIPTCLSVCPLRWPLKSGWKSDQVLQRPKTARNWSHLACMQWHAHPYTSYASIPHYTATLDKQNELICGPGHQFKWSWKSPSPSRLPFRADFDASELALICYLFQSVLPWRGYRAPYSICMNALLNNKLHGYELHENIENLIWVLQKYPAFKK